MEMQDSVHILNTAQAKDQSPNTVKKGKKNEIEHGKSLTARGKRPKISGSFNGICSHA